MPKKQSEFLDVKQFRVEDGFFSPLQRLVREGVIPYEERALNDQVPGVKKSHAIENFRIAAGESDDEHYGKVYQDSDLAKWLEAVAYRLGTHPDPELEARADEVIRLIGKAQQPDGYLDTYFINKEPEHRWQNLTDCHELYCAGHLTEAAVAYYESTGKDTLLNICRKLCDHIDNRFGPGKATGIPGHEEIELALLRLYRVTGEKRYLNLARYFIDERGKDPEFFHKEAAARGWGRTDFYDNVSPEYMQNHRPVREQDTVEGHSVRCMYLLTAMADLAALNDDKELWDACQAMWNNMVTRRMYLTGGIGSNADGEAFTIDYDLPNDSIYAETCASVGVCFAARRMLEAEPDARYADILEKEFYNGTISGMQLDGTKFFYVNPLEINPGVSGVVSGYRHVLPERPGWYDCACCPPNLARLLASLGSYVWSAGDTVAYSHLFVGGEADLPTAGGVRISLESGYPWEGGLIYTITPHRENLPFTLAIRRPGWCRKCSLSINGEVVTEDVPCEKGYFLLSRSWKSGDRVEYRLELPVVKMYAHPAVRADAGCVALMRGPLVYAFESTDNGDGLQAVRIPRESHGKALPFEPELLKGVVPVEIPARRRLAADTLYSDTPPEEEEITLRAIPYYAWGNRGLCQMRVWMLE